MKPKEILVQPNVEPLPDKPMQNKEKTIKNTAFPFTLTLSEKTSPLDDSQIVPDMQPLSQKEIDEVLRLLPTINKEKEQDPLSNLPPGKKKIPKKSSIKQIPTNDKSTK